MRKTLSHARQSLVVGFARGPLLRFRLGRSRRCDWVSPCGHEDSLGVFLSAHHARHGAAHFFESGKIPKIRKITALLGFHRLHGTILAFEKYALAAGLFLQREPLPVVRQPRVLLNEIELGHPLPGSKP